MKNAEGQRTARLSLRPPALADALALSALMTPAVSGWLASWPVPFTPAMATVRIAGAQRAAERGTALPFVVERRADGAVLGWIRVARDAIDGRRGSLGYWLGEAHQGQGYMREAAPVTVAAAFQLLGLEVVEGAARPGNAASLATLRACGMTPTGKRMVFAQTRNRAELCDLFAVARSGGPVSLG